MSEDTGNHQRLLSGLRGVSEDSNLWAGILWLLDGNEDADLEGLCLPEIGDEQAHRSRGRLSAWRDLKEQLQTARREANQTMDPVK